MEKAEAAEPRLLAGEVVRQQVAAQPHLLAVEVARQQEAAQPQLLAVEVARQQGAAQPQLPAEVAHQRAVVVPVRPLPEAAVVSPLRAVAVRKRVVAATRTEMPGIEETSKSMSAVLPLGDDTTAACGMGSGGTSGAGGGTSTALAVAGLKPRSVSYGFAAERSRFSGSVIARTKLSPSSTVHS